MEDRITLNYIYIGLISSFLTLVLTLFAFHSVILSQAQSDLKQEATLLAEACDQGELDQLTDYLKPNCQLVILDADGTLHYCSAPEAVSDDADSPEILQALSEGTGNDRRSGENARRVQQHCAVLLNDGKVLCLSKDAPQLLNDFSQLAGYLILIFLLMVTLSFLLSLVLTRRLIRPIKELPQQLEQPGFDPEASGVYPELLPLLQELAERRNERETMRQEFTANVSHELKTPLTTISGYSEMIANGLAKPEDIARFAEKIHAESERMQTLVGDIIELNALDSEMIHEHSDAVDMLALVQDCMEQLSPHFSAKRLSVYVTGERFVVQGNQRQLWELVYNLLDNARRYNVNGGMIRVQLHQRTLTIQDTGIGIAKEHQTRVFERFYRVDKSHSRATGGTGLGLSIVKHVAELHGATIQLESTEHIGTTISISFPE
jgi:two-component system phosphate regulon sensor histidine kinase PhoR